MIVQIVCRNWEDDRVLPRMARLLRDNLGWSISPVSEAHADINYYLGYFEAPRNLEHLSTLTAAYLTHREEQPLNHPKALLFDKVAQITNLRVVTCHKYQVLVEQWGTTLRAHAPVEQERFTIAPLCRHSKPVVGFSGFLYMNGRKGETLARELVNSPLGQRCEFIASGRGWPVRTRKYTWAEMPAFYQGLDVLVCTSLVEGIPMPPLEALACGVSVVVPYDVGMMDELPEMPGIYHYEKGNSAELQRAVERAIDERAQVNREELRASIAEHSDRAWVEDHREAFEKLLGVQQEPVSAQPQRSIQKATPMAYNTRSERGIYVVAFGEPARESARRLLASIQRYMPDIPVALVGSEPLRAGETVFIEYSDTDIGGRRAKLAIDSLAPKEWKEILYLDADTELIAPVYQLFDWIHDGWDMLICRDVYPRDSLLGMHGRYDAAETQATYNLVYTWELMQLNGGVFCYQRNARTEQFFRAWRDEYERWLQRDQGALLRALYQNPLKLLVLGNEWNTFPRSQDTKISAGILHYPQEARRWRGQIPGRIDTPEAWQAVKRFENERNSERGAVIK